MMKKYIALLLCLCLMFVFAGCKNTPENLSSVDSGITSTQTSENQESESTAEDTSDTDTSSINNSSNNSVVNNNNGGSGSSNNNGGNKNNNNNTNTNTNTNNNNNNNNNNNSFDDIPESTDPVQDMINHAISHDGTTFSDKKTAKDTDKVSMNNIYVNMGEDVVIEEYRELDTLVMNAINNTNSPKYLRINDKFIPVLNDYRKKFQTLRGYHVHFSEFSTPEVFFYELEVYNTQNARTEYNNNMQNNTNTYANEIKKAINECGIYKGMLQKDAIIKINEWICKKVEYQDHTNGNKLSSFFGNGKVTCGAYAQVFELMCRNVGIDARYVDGYDSGNHAWNVIYFSDGSKYYFDLTMNDSYITFEGKNYQKIDRALFVTSFTNRQIDIIKTVGYSELP